MFEISTSDYFTDEEKAREFLEAKRWPDGPVCPHCDSKEAYKLEPKPSKKDKHVRKGVYKCANCREQFTVTIGTIFEDSHIPLNKWLLAFHLLCASKKGMSAHQLHRMLGVAYRSAWFMAHRIRYAMSQPSFTEKLTGVVEADETYVGGVQKGFKGREINTRKRPVFSLVKRGGEVRSFHVERVTAENLGGIIKKNVCRSAHLSTDEFMAYERVGGMFAAHVRVNHSKGQYKSGYAHTNTLEGYFSLLKRGLNGTYHQVSEDHLHRYLSEFDFRYNNRKVKDADRTMLALKGVEGKRLQLRDSEKSISPSEKTN